MNAKGVFVRTEGDGGILALSATDFQMECEGKGTPKTQSLQKATRRALTLCRSGRITGKPEVTIAEAKVRQCCSLSTIQKLPIRPSMVPA